MHGTPVECSRIKPLKEGDSGRLVRPLSVAANLLLANNQRQVDARALLDGEKAAARAG